VERAYPEDQPSGGCYPAAGLGCWGGDFAEEGEGGGVEV